VNLLPKNPAELLEARLKKTRQGRLGCHSKLYLIVKLPADRIPTFITRAK
jgi:hypothetical protein